MGYEKLYERGPGFRAEARQKYHTLMQTDFVDLTTNNRWYLEKAVKNWNRWRVTDKNFINARNRHTCTTDGLLRSPPSNELYLALDKHEKVFILLDPAGLYDVFDEDVVARMLSDAKLFYPSLRTPN